MNYTICEDMDSHLFLIFVLFLSRFQAAFLFDFRRLQWQPTSKVPQPDDATNKTLIKQSTPDAQFQPRQFNPWFGGFGGGFGPGGFGPGGFGVGGFGPGGFGRFPNNGGGGGSNANPRCPAGYFCQSVNSRRICGEGYFCPEGSNSQTPCRVGTYARRGASACITCPPGYQCPQQTVDVGGTPTLRGAITPTQCGAGFHCPPGTGSAIDCPSGHYCTNENAPDFAPIPCPGGSYSSTVRSSSPSDCLTCPAGTYSSAGASACTAGSINTNNNAGFGAGGFNPYFGGGGYGGFPNYGGGGFGGFPNYWGG